MSKHLSYLIDLYIDGKNQSTPKLAGFYVEYSHIIKSSIQTTYI